MLHPHQARPCRDRRGQGRSNLGPVLDPRSQLPRKPHARSPPGRQRLLRRAGGGLSRARRPLSGHLAAGALGPDSSRRGQARRVRTLPASRRCLRVLPGVRPGHRVVRRAVAQAPGLSAARGWVDEGGGALGFPNLLLIVPEGVREREVGSALRYAIGIVQVRRSLATSFPLYVAGEDQLTELGVLGPAWRHLPTDGDRVSLLDLPVRPRDLYRATRCLGRYFTDANASHRRRISPISATPRFRALPPRHAP